MNYCIMSTLYNRNIQFTIIVDEISMNTKKLFDLSDKVIIITGAAGNLGSQYAEGLSQAGANVVLGDLDYTKCKQ